MQSSCTVSIKRTYIVNKLKQSYPDDFQAVFVIIRGTTAEMSSKSIHNFLSIVPNGQTDTDSGENISSLMDLNIDNTEAYKCTIYSPTLYSQITGKYASVESKIFPHILLLCSISYSCFNGLTINQHFIKPLQGEKCTSYLSVEDLSIVLPRVFFFAALCGRTNLRLRSRARTPTKLLRSTF